MLGRNGQLDKMQCSAHSCAKIHGNENVSFKAQNLNKVSKLGRVFVNYNLLIVYRAIPLQIILAYHL